MTATKTLGRGRRSLPGTSSACTSSARTPRRSTSPSRSPATHPRASAQGSSASVDRVRRRVEELAGIGSASPIPAAELTELATREQRIYERVNGVIGARRARTAELQWLLRRAAVAWCR